MIQDSLEPHPPTFADMGFLQFLRLLTYGKDFMILLDVLEALNKILSVFLRNKRYYKRIHIFYIV
jgi:hypothetical protein